MQVGLRRFQTSGRSGNQGRQRVAQWAHPLGCDCGHRGQDRPQPRTGTTFTPEKGKRHKRRRCGCCGSLGGPWSQGLPAAAPSGYAGRTAATFSFTLVLIKDEGLAHHSTALAPKPPWSLRFFGGRILLRSRTFGANLPHFRKRDLNGIVNPVKIRGRTGVGRLPREHTLL